MDTALATGQSRLAKNSSDRTRPIISWSDLPSSEGMTYSPTAGMNTSNEPATMPGKDSGSVMRRNDFHGRAPLVHRVAPEHFVHLGDDLVEAIEQLLGPGSATLR